MGLYASVYFTLVNVLLLPWLTLCALQKQEGCFNLGRVAASLPPKCTQAGTFILLDRYIYLEFQ